MALAMALPTGAFALSCAQVSPEEVYKNLDAAPEAYVLVRANVIRLPGTQTRATRDANNMGVPFQTEVLVKGRLGGRSGFVRPFEERVTVNVSCAAHWCGGLPPDPGFLFLRQEAEGYVLDMGACGGPAFPDLRDTFTPLRACLAGRCP